MDDQWTPETLSAQIRAKKEARLAAEAAAAATAAAAAAATSIRCTGCDQTFDSIEQMQKHAWYAHVGTACQVAGCGHTTTNEAAMRIHLCDDHDRSRRRYECLWDPCGQTFPTRIAANDCFHKHQALAFAAATDAVPVQKQQQQQQQG
ncbi:hypothetical protein PG991_005365 [Apiospora marii]|uniref:C2H2-type domain-containing protein n=1 Tax=Apiospora marii TaxID=335849 RepID=A0ABR1S8Z1_9PEZI